MIIYIDTYHKRVRFGLTNINSLMNSTTDEINYHIINTILYYQSHLNIYHTYLLEI